MMFLTVLASVVGVLMLAASSASALSIGLDWSGDNTKLAPEMREVQYSGASEFHMPLAMNGTGSVEIPWCAPGVEPGWSFYDPIFQSALEHGITIAPDLIRQKSGVNQFPEKGEIATWDCWVQKVVARYGYGGSFWVGKPGAKPVTAWTVWNEPNLPENNPGGTAQAAKYGEFLASTAATIRGAQVGYPAQVLFGGLYLPAGNGISYLKNATATSGAGAYDGVNIHPYSFWGGVPELGEEVASVRYALDHTVSGGTGKPLWIGELGWPVANPGAGSEVTPVPAQTPAQQAALLTAAFNWIKANAATDNIQAVDWYNLRDPGSARWDGFCGLRTYAGEYRPAWYAFLEETGAPRPDPALAIVNENENRVYAKSGSLTAGWVDEYPGLGIESVDVAADPGHGPVIAVVASNGHLYVKEGIIGGWIDEKAGVKSAAVAADYAHEPLVGAVDSSGRAWVKNGTGGPWVEEWESAAKISLASDAVNGPLIGVLTTSGHALVKQGSFTAPWVDEWETAQDLQLASDAVNGPLIGVLTSAGHSLVKQGGLYANWVDEWESSAALSLSTDATRGPLIGVITKGGLALVKEGALNANWVEEWSSAKNIDVAIGRENGAIIAVLTPAGTVLAKQGLFGGWIEEAWTTKAISVAAG